MLRSFFRKLRKAGQPFRRTRFRPLVEGLEVRVTPALLTVGPGKQFATISNAVATANPGDQVEVFNGANSNSPYIEQVYINKNLQLFAAPGNSPIIQAPTTLTSLQSLALDPVDDTQAIVTIFGNTHPSVTVQGFIINGALLSRPQNPIDAGIYVRDGATVIIGGTSATAVGGAGATPGNTIENLRDAPVSGSGFSQNGTGILIGQSLTNNQNTVILSTSGHASIIGNTIFQYQKDGVAVINGSTALVQSNSIFGVGRQGQVAQNGIDTESSLIVALGNFIRFNEYAPPNGQGQIPSNPALDTNANPFDSTTFQAGGILVNNAAVGSLVSGNVVDANDFGIDTFNAGTAVPAASQSALTVSFNQLGYSSANRYEGILLDQGSTNLVQNTVYGGNAAIFAGSFNGSTDNTNAFLSGNVVALANFGLLAQNDPAGTSFNPMLVIGSPRTAPNSVQGNLLVSNNIAGIKLDAGVETILGNQVNSNGVGIWVTGGVTQQLSLNVVSGNSSDQIRVTGGFVPSITDNDLSIIASKAINNQTANPILAPSNYYFEIGYGNLSNQAAAAFTAQIAGLISGPVDASDFLLTKPVPTPNPVPAGTQQFGIIPAPNELFPTHLSLDLLGATLPNATYFNQVSQLVNGTGTTTSIATTLVSSTQFIDHQIQLIYNGYLGRAATPQEVTAGENTIAAGGSFDNIRVTALSTQDFFNKAGGTNTGFVNLLFQDVLGRAPSQAELTADVTALNGGTSRSTIAANVVFSGEAQVRKIILYYQALLGRSPNQTEINNGLAQPTEQALIVSIVSTPEYFHKLP